MARDWHQIRCALHLHDDCFAKIQPVNRTLLVRLVHSTLKQHSFYLGQDIDWSPALNPLTDLLEAVEEFELITDTAKQTILVDWPTQTIRRERSIPVNSYFARLTISDGKASYQNLATDTQAR